MSDVLSFIFDSRIHATNRWSAQGRIGRRFDVPFPPDQREPRPSGEVQMGAELCRYLGQ